MEFERADWVWTRGDHRGGVCLFVRVGKEARRSRKPVPHLCGPELEERGSSPRFRVRSLLVQEAMVAPLPQAPV